MAILKVLVEVHGSEFRGIIYTQRMGIPKEQVALHGIEFLAIIFIQLMGTPKEQVVPRTLEYLTAMYILPTVIQKGQVVRLGFVSHDQIGVFKQYPKIHISKCTSIGLEP